MTTKLLPAPRPLTLSESISLGSTMVGEIRDVWFDPIQNCGCALGTGMIAKVGVDETWNRTLHDFIPHVYTEWYWTQLPIAYAPELIEVWRSSEGYYPAVSTIAVLISDLHCIVGVPRLELARLLRKIEDRLETTYNQQETQNGQDSLTHDHARRVVQTS